MITRFDKHQHQKQWNQFVKANQQTHFFFQTDYLFYHQERFEDFSLCCWNLHHELEAVLPACIEEKTVFSHKGLTFGGIVFKDTLNFVRKQQIFEEFIDFLKANTIYKLVLKPLPSYFYQDESLLRLAAFYPSRLSLEANLVIDLHSSPAYHTRKKRNIKKANSYHLTIENIRDKAQLSTCWEILTHNLATRHQRKPVHSLDEIYYLQTKFSTQIEIWATKINQVITSFVVLFKQHHVVHLQYIASTSIGRSTNSLDFLIDSLIFLHKDNYKYLSLGVSELRAENRINPSLWKWKEEFGATVFSHFCIDVLIG